MEIFKGFVPYSAHYPSQPLHPDHLCAQNSVQVTPPSPSHFLTLVYHLLHHPPTRSPRGVATKVIGRSISNINRCPPATHSPCLTFEHPLPHELNVSGHPTELRRQWHQDCRRSLADPYPTLIDIPQLPTLPISHSNDLSPTNSMSPVTPLN